MTFCRLAFAGSRRGSDCAAAIRRSDMPVARHLWIAGLLLLSPLGVRADEAKLETDTQKALYGLGTQVAEDLKQRLGFLDLSKEEMTLFLSGIDDQFAGKSRLDPKDPAQTQRLETFRRDRMQSLLEKETVEAKKFVDTASKEKGAVKSQSGLVYKEVSAGKGQAPGATDVVKVHYEGKLRDGTVFDSSRERGEPIEFPLNGVIPCWTEALQKMKVGGKAKLTCPAEIAYGNSGSPPKIKPGAALAFDVELISVTKNDQAPSAGAPVVPPPNTSPKK
jgi:FKBP-type peptidyl-prolyl cis-trans isomerase FkpA